MQHAKATALYHSQHSFPFHQVPTTAGWPEAVWIQSLPTGLGFFRKKLVSSETVEETGKNLEETGQNCPKWKKLEKTIYIV